MSRDPVVVFAGNVGRDRPQEQLFRDGGRLARFSLAYTPQKRSGDGYEDLPPVWLQVEASGSLATRVMEHVGPGDLVIVSGVLRSWVGEDQKSRLKLRADHVGMHLHGRRFAGPPDHAAGPAGPSAGPAGYSPGGPAGGSSAGGWDGGGSPQWGDPSSSGASSGGWGL